MNKTDTSTANAEGFHQRKLTKTMSPDERRLMGAFRSWMKNPTAKAHFAGLSELMRIHEITAHLNKPVMKATQTTTPQPVTAGCEAPRND